VDFGLNRKPHLPALVTVSTPKLPPTRALAAAPAPVPAATPARAPPSPAPTRKELVVAGLDKGKEAFDKKDYAEAMRQDRDAAGHGRAPAQTAIDDLFEYGLGVAEDYGEVMRWGWLTTDQGNAPGEIVVGARFRRARGRKGRSRRRRLVPQGHQSELCPNTKRSRPAAYLEMLVWPRIMARQCVGSARRPTRINIGNL